MGEELKGNKKEDMREKRGLNIMKKYDMNKGEVKVFLCLFSTV